MTDHELQANALWTQQAWQELGCTPRWTRPLEYLSIPADYRKDRSTVNHQLLVVRNPRGRLRGQRTLVWLRDE